ncbi:MAG: hypothetical protein ACN6O6_16035 [Pseudomonas sp.]|uniref:hypothetical protein n=1 Tax=Pseudomonas sp. TaxID=306 RepID=UPI003D0CEB9A
MTMRSCLKTLAPLLAFAFLAEGHAMSRHHDGDAQVWVRERSLCIGTAATYEVSGFFPSTARLDQNQVTLYAVQVNRPSYQAWSAQAPRGTTGSSVQLQPGACIEYGKPIALFSTTVSPRELEPGVYEVLLQASDQKNRRAWFYKRFCLSSDSGSWAVTDAVRAEGTSQWRCERSPD